MRSRDGMIITLPCERWTFQELHDLQNKYSAGTQSECNIN